MLARKLSSAEELSLLTLDEIGALVMRSFPKAEWNGKNNLREARRQLEICKGFNIGWLKVSDSGYPVLLKSITNPPYLIFVRGNKEALCGQTVSVVGTRQLSPEGKKAAFNFGYEASRAGISVVSGLALGADGYAHKGAVDSFMDSEENGEDCSSLGKTIAVLPCSIDQVAPVSHVKLAENIIKSGGCLVSEYGPLIPFASWHYVQRNRIIAALSPATVVVEAPNGSGSLITVDFALEFGRDVMFHEACFNEYAKKINETVKQNLEKQYNNKKVTRHKLEVSVQGFVDEGAPVIRNFEDYCKCLRECPGTRSLNKIQQLELFN